MVDGCAEHFHGRGKVHIGIDERRYVLSIVLYLLLQHLVSLPVIEVLEQFLEVRVVFVALQRGDRPYKGIAVGKILVQEMEEQIPCPGIV